MYYIVFFENRNRSRRKVVTQPTPDTEIRFSEEIEDPNKRAADCNVKYQVSSKNK